MKVKELIKLMENDGWLQVRMKGSHRRWKTRGDIPPGTLASILKQAGLK